MFLHVETDGDVSGMVGPISDRRARGIHRFEKYLVGRDPLATEKLWDLLYRKAVHGRKGTTMMAISALDVALWDLKGQYFGEPVYRLLGGPTRETLPAYASMLGYSVDPEDVREVPPTSGNGATGPRSGSSDTASAAARRASERTSNWWRPPGRPSAPSTTSCSTPG